MCALVILPYWGKISVHWWIAVLWSSVLQGEYAEEVLPVEHEVGLVSPPLLSEEMQFDVYIVDH